MVTRTVLDLEGSDDFDYSIATTDGKGITEIVLDIMNPEASVFRELARKHGVDIAPFTKAPRTKDEMVGEWQDPGVLLTAATRLYKALEAEGEDLVGRMMGENEIKLKDLSYYKLSLYDIMKFCETAIERNKQLRFMMY